MKHLASRGWLVVVLVALADSTIVVLRSRAQSVTFPAFTAELDEQSFEFPTARPRGTRHYRIMSFQDGSYVEERSPAGGPTLVTIVFDKSKGRRTFIDH